MHGDIDWAYPFATAPRVFASIATFNGGDAAALRMAHDATKKKAVVYVQEETCADDELEHVAEAISYIAITPGRRQTRAILPLCAPPHRATLRYMENSYASR
jgi:hypothetical protein